ncbi:uncharacterized protein BCR38DRAFT_461815 [Pseudomassariella vexata]|uniref:alpha-1,3-glucan synthase n=1 Tax=Pseudomassariella vexata TaxID=1141098 RepID=A0A1Y2D9D7_9PEZI|nr:uncharacterized protein BCR38DRAFT_461815 [Pseudomassariella vexata]ORY55827.1 hypothetical protein BCR38DRAFT_461815 [Pseudomassariella vexata]
MLAIHACVLLLVSAWTGLGQALRYEDTHADWNLNQNDSATDPLDYWGEWTGHSYTPSPDNWRFPYYTLSPDRFANGDPTNDEANGTMFEHDWMSNQFRFGGDVRGLMNELDYIQGMGIKAIYLMGSPFINQPWMADGYSPLDFTLLDHHHGVIDDWRQLIDAIHDRGMYVLLDNTMSTMGDLLAFSGHLNVTAPFNWNEYDYTWKYPERRYHDFQPGNAVNESCEYPRFWGDDGYLQTYSDASGCRISEFSSYGDLENTGHFSVYQNQLSKYGSVQDRLRAWRGDVLDKIKHFSCMQISMLDIDGFRMDKALQNTVDSLAEFSAYQRECARRYNKENFYIIGEVVGTDQQAAIYYGRGMQPNQYFMNSTVSALSSNTTDDTTYVRDFGLSGLDGAGFHYTVYGALTRLLGLDGNIGENGVNFVELWRNIVLQNDLVNSNTGEFDPRHQFGTSDQDVFRWPALENGTQRQLLAHFITTLEMPGSPALFWGEEQSFYILDSTAENFVYGRQPMSSSRGWQIHGCYQISDATYTDFPLGPARHGCNDDNVSLDHKDPSHPVRNVLKRMYELRLQYPTLNDGWYLEMLSNQTRDIYLPGSDGLPSPTGIVSVYRAGLAGVQDLDGVGQGNQGIWLVYSNENQTKEFEFDCANATAAMVSPFLANTVVKNLLYPYDEHVLENSSVAFDRDGSTGFAGCLSNMTMDAWGFKAFVPIDNYMAPSPSITSVVPSHDQRILASVELGQQQTIPIEIHFSMAMDCSSVTDTLVINSTTLDGNTASIDGSSVVCTAIENDTPEFVANLENVSHGIHTFSVKNASTGNGTYTNAVDRFMFRLGDSDNPMVFPGSANYTSGLLHLNESTNNLYISPRAAGSTFSSWEWTGTSKQEWTGEHVIVQYWSAMAASAEHLQHADLDSNTARRWPHAFVLGTWNTWGYDDGLDSAMSLKSNGTWTFNLATEWPSKTTINVWGVDPDGLPDKAMEFGDVDGDHVLDWLHPDTLSDNVVNILVGPDMPYTAWKLVVNDGNYTYYLEPTGSAYHQLALSILLGVVPVLTGFLAVWAFKKSFYHVKFNQVGIADKTGILNTLSLVPAYIAGAIKHKKGKSIALASQFRRTVLIATMEYEIEDWKIKVKIGGLGVMASLMGKALGHQDLIWVVPCIGGIDYPTDTPAAPMVVTINETEYTINVQYHYLRNITFVLLDAPVFRQQTKDDPYPARMDDLDSAVYYSAWNACIAEAIKRFPQVDLYHINDYHGAIAPLYLLPKTIPVSLSLHNAEFQGLWSLRSKREMREITSVFNLSKEVVKKYVQFGEVFNLLHAGASYLRLHQKGFGAVGVSNKYGTRALKRYPIFWGLSNIGALPNPDPSDNEAWDEKRPDPNNVVIDIEAEAARGQLRCKAQEWAGLKVDPDAELFVFVGRWSEQKGVDLIADVFPALLDRHKDVQLICVGPVIDLYGKFAALKLQKMMDRYPGRVFSKPQFTALPPFLFSGAEFALIPSRDEPFGLVAVEFGRKGALGVGSRVGGLGQMPGWWFTIESTATKHLLRQFKSAIEDAMASSRETRALMRARSSLQRFPVAQWVKDLEILQSTSIHMHGSVARGSTISLLLPPPTGVREVIPPVPPLPPSLPSTAYPSRAPSPVRGGSKSPTSCDSSGASAPTHKRSKVNTGLSVLTPRLHTLAQLERRTDDDAPPLPGSAYIMNSPGPLSASTYAMHSPGPLSGSDTEDCSPQNFLSPGLNNKESASNLSVDVVAGGRNDFELQNVDPFFNDPTGRYYDTFAKQLDAHDGSLSHDKLCVEEYLLKSEKDWFGRFYNAKLGKSTTKVNRGSVTSVESADIHVIGEADEFQLSDKYKPPKGAGRFLQAKVGDWPVYAFFIAFGQIIAANSYQITLLTGQNGESADRLYTVSSIFLAASIAWWFLFRHVKSVYTLSLPFVFYGVAFFLLGMTPYAASTLATTWVQNVATGFYAVGSASGFLFFTMNFLSEGGTPVRSWVFRACIIQGTQQLYLAALWYWGSYVSSLHNSGITTTISPTTVTAIAVPVAVLMWAIGFVLLLGLPEAYRARPGNVPAFYISLVRRKVVVWFFVVVIIQNYFLSAPYGRSWTYLWSSDAAPVWSIVLLVIFFFVIVWALVLGVFALLSGEHSWALPLFAIGLGAPRWAQMLWGTSGIGMYIPWIPFTDGTTNPVAGALLGRALWLWLGVLDTLQGVGFGMILLQTLTRVHMSCAIAVAQVLGSIFTIAARASAPNKTGPGRVFPNLSVDLLDGIVNIWLWVPLGFQLAVCVGFFVFFRKEQLFKP